MGRGRGGGYVADYGYAPPRGYGPPPGYGRGGAGAYGRPYFGGRGGGGRLAYSPGEDYGRPEDQAPPDPTNTDDGNRPYHQASPGVKGRNCEFLGSTLKFLFIVVVLV